MSDERTAEQRAEDDLTELNALIAATRTHLLEVIGPGLEQGLVAERYGEIVRAAVPTQAAPAQQFDVAQAASAGLAALIDHTALKPETTPTQIKTLCEEALSQRFAAVCVNGVHVALCRQILAGVDRPALGAVAGFPLGAMVTKTKAYEAMDVVRLGATEVDTVMNIGALKAGLYRVVFDDLCQVVTMAAPARVKIIIETGLLTREEKVAACLLVRASGAHFVKTCTGFASGGATVQDVALLRHVVGPTLGVKASAGIRTREQALALVQAGATRLGTSHGMRLLTEE